MGDVLPVWTVQRYAARATAAARMRLWTYDQSCDRRCANRPLPGIAPAGYQRHSGCMSPRIARLSVVRRLQQGTHDATLHYRFAGLQRYFLQPLRITLTVPGDRPAARTHR